MNFKPTKEQERIFKFIQKRPENIIVEALAGCGKTSTIIEAVKLLPENKTSIFLAFNKHIKAELEQKLPEKMFCYTFHGLGMGAIKRKYGDSIKFDEFKVDHIIKKKSKNWKLKEEFPDTFQQMIYLGNIKKLVNMCRQTLAMKKEYLPAIADKYEINLKSPKDFKRVLSVLEVMLNDRTMFDFIDMIFLPAMDKKIWLFQHDYVIVDEIQDLNRAQQAILEKCLKREKKTGRITGRIIGVGDKNQCQPEGTKILMHDGTEKNIEDVKINDIVVSYNRKEKGQFVGRYRNKVSNWLFERAPKVLEIKKTKYDKNSILEYNPLVVIETENKTSKYTPNHKCMVRFNKNHVKKHVLYLMEKKGIFRIGITPLWSSTGNDFASYRARQEGSEKMWILNYYEDKFKAYLDEQYYSLIYGIPQLRFKDNKTIGNYNQKNIDEFYSRFDKNVLLYNVNNLLGKFNKYYSYPFWIKNSKKHFSKSHIFEQYACNVEEKIMDVVEFNENNRKVRTHGDKKSNNIIAPTYINIKKIILEEYSGYVYSLKIAKYELYVADGILTHNSIYGFTGVSEKSFDWFLNLPHTQIMPLTHTFRCGTNIVKKANTIVPELKAMDGAIDGIVREGSVLDEPTDGDFVLCRTTAPLINLFFYYLIHGKKSVIKGMDFGLSLIDMTKGQKTVASLLGYWGEELETMKKDLKKKGIINPQEHSGFVALEDKVMVLDFVGQLSDSISDMNKKISTIFTDDLEGIVLSTIHKSKGLEADRVFIARPDKLPLKVKKAWQFKQEKNLEYVAITRARKELIYDHEWSDETEEEEDGKNS